MIILFCVFLVVVFRPDFHPPPFPVPDSISDAFWRCDWSAFIPGRVLALVDGAGDQGRG